MVMPNTADATRSKVGLNEPNLGFHFNKFDLIRHFTLRSPISPKSYFIKSPKFASSAVDYNAKRQPATDVPNFLRL